MMDQDLLSELQYALLEPPDGGQSWPSEVWRRDDVLDAVNSACRQLLRDTEAQTTRLEQALPGGSLSVSLPADWLASVHLVWRVAASNARQYLCSTDAFEADHARPGWEVTQGTPIAYADLDTNTLELRLVPTPNANGFLEHLYVPNPPEVNGNGSTVGVPDLIVSGVKYGALATLLRGVNRLGDPERAAYADERYQITSIATTLLLGGGA